MRTNFKRFLATTCAVLTMVSTSNVTTVLASSGYDTTAPEITRLEVSTTEANPGDTVNFSVSVVEDGTGLADLNVTFMGKIINASLSDDSFSGTYDISYTIPENAVPGEYHIQEIKSKDVAGNISICGDYWDTIITVVDPTYVDDPSPVLIDTYPEYSEIEVPGNQIINVICNDDDLASITVHIGCVTVVSDDYNKEVEFEVNEISDDGTYQITVPFEDYLINGEYNYYLSLVDVAGNETSYCIGESSTIFTTIYDGETEDLDTVSPTITSISTSVESDIILPGLADITISGTEDKSSMVSGYVYISNPEATGNNKYVNFTAEVVDGTWTTTETFTFDENAKEGTYNTVSMYIEDESGNNEFKDAIQCSWNTIHEATNIETETTLTNPNLVNIIENMDEGKSVLIRANTNIVSENLFEAIAGQDKNIILDQTGIQWIFNGKDINSENIKDIDISLGISEATSLTDLGYEEGTSGVVFDFASNGFLPGKATIRIKSDYITNKYNLSTKLYLACIRETVECEEELRYTNLEWPTDEDGNPIYYVTEYVYDESGNITYYPEYDEEGNEVVDEDGNVVYSDIPVTTITFVDPEEVEIIEKINYTKEQLVQIEDAGITLDENGYITITMTHNSSYVLSSSLPVVASAANNNNNNSSGKPNTEQNKPVLPADDEESSNIYDDHINDVNEDDSTNAKPINSIVVVPYNDNNEDNENITSTKNVKVHDVNDNVAIDESVVKTMDIISAEEDIITTASNIPTIKKATSENIKDISDDIITTDNMIAGSSNNNIVVLVIIIIAGLVLAISLVLALKHKSLKL